MTDRYAARAGQTAAQEIDGEAVVINFDTFHYYGLNRTGTAVWRLLQAGSYNRAALAHALGVAFGRSVDVVGPDVDALVDALLAEGLIEQTGRPAATAAVVDAGGEYVAPRLEKHEKLDQLMLSGE